MKKTYQSFIKDNLVYLAVILFIAIISANNSFASPVCGDLATGYGPFDYTDPQDLKKLPVVETYHFTPKVEQLRGGESSYIWDDLDYTLRAFPNHHRALYAFVRYEIKMRQKSQQKNNYYKPPMTKYGYPASAECYFDRALRWRPNDPTVRMLYGLYLHRKDDLRKALDQYRISEKIQPNVADLQYNLGLLYFDLKNYKLAKEHAKKAYQLGYPLPGLRKKLASIGQWP